MNIHTYTKYTYTNFLHKAERRTARNQRTILSSPPEVGVKTITLIV